jgi:hypothetical protein
MGIDPKPKRPTRRDIAIVISFVGLLFIPFQGKAYHIDEPLSVDFCQRLLLDPAHPLDAAYITVGHAVSLRRLNDNPPIFYHLLALVLKIAGTNEFTTRLALLPLDAAAALALYLLAARFLSRPLFPTLVVLACPAYWINMNHLMDEKAVVPFGLWGLYALVRGVDDKEPRRFWLSAILLGAAMLSKFNAVVFLLPAVGYGLHRGVARLRLCAYAALACAGPAAWLVSSHWARHPAPAELWDFISRAMAEPWSSWPHKIRSILSFIGGCGLVTAVWPLLSRRPGGWRGFALVSVVVILFLPAWDLEPLVRPIDRFLGMVLSFGALWGLWDLLSSLKGSPPGSGRHLWAPWVLSGIVWLCLYWSIPARMVLLLLPPLVFALAESLESAMPDRELTLIYSASLAGTLALGLTLNIVDYKYAASQKEFAQRAARLRRVTGGRLWCNAIGGLKYYLEHEGAQDLVYSRGGWAQVRRGDIVVMSRLWSGLRPADSIHGEAQTTKADCAIPLRLISLWDGQGGFYSNVWGFLPYSLSREPLDEFTTVKVL